MLQLSNSPDRRQTMQLSTTPMLLCRCRQLEQGTDESGEGRSGSTGKIYAGQELEGLHQELGQVQERLHLALQELDELRNLHVDAQGEVSPHAHSRSGGAAWPACRGLGKG